MRNLLLMHWPAHVTHMLDDTYPRNHEIAEQINGRHHFGSQPLQFNKWSAPFAAWKQRWTKEVAPSSATQLKLKFRVDKDGAIELLIAVRPASEIRLPPSANVCSFLEALVASYNRAIGMINYNSKYGRVQAACPRTIIQQFLSNTVDMTHLAEIACNLPQWRQLRCRQHGCRRCRDARG